MKKILLLSLLIVSSISFTQTAPSSGAYQTDETDYFVAGNRVNESLERVNLLLCLRMEIVQIARQIVAVVTVTKL